MVALVLGGQNYRNEGLNHNYSYVSFFAEYLIKERVKKKWNARVLKSDVSLTRISSQKQMCFHCKRDPMTGRKIRRFVVTFCLIENFLLIVQQ